MNSAYARIIGAADADRRDLFATAARRIGTTEQYVEKDFWVCWTLDALFHRLPPGGPRLLFKGGTSLSKAFGLIHRFSEDIDITVFRDDLGQAAPLEDLEAISGKKRRARLDAIRDACRGYIREDLRSQLEVVVARSMEAAGVGPDAATVALDADDPDGQTILVHYPSVVTAAAPYVRPSVRIESGAKSALDPHVAAEIEPYVAVDASLPELRVRHVTTIEPQRTFWDTGAGRNIDEAHQPAMVERKGVKIGFLQYTARWYQDTDQIATPTEAGIAKISSIDGITIDPADVERVKNDIMTLRSQVDIVVVSHHNRDGATNVQFGSVKPTSASNDRTKAEEYQRNFAHLALDAGADVVFGHGTHTIQGVEVYQGKPILYALGHSNFDQPGYENAKDGLVVRVIIQGKNILRASFVPVTRDGKNDVAMLDPSSAEGATLVQMVRDRSFTPPSLRIDGQEVVMLEKAAMTSSNKR